MKTFTFGLTVVGLATAAPCSVQQTETLGLAILQTSTCDDIKTIDAPDCTEGGQDVSTSLQINYSLCVQMGHTEWLNYILNQAGGGNGSGDMGSGSGSGDSSEDCVGPDCCTNQQKLNLFTEMWAVQACSDVSNVPRPNCKDAPDMNQFAGFCNSMGLAKFKEYIAAEIDAIGPDNGNGNGNDSGSGGMGSGDGSGSGDSCDGPDCDSNEPSSPPTKPPTKPPTSASPGVKPILLALAAPLLALYLVL